MFLEVRKDPLVMIQHIAMDSRHIASVTSNLLINLGQVAEVSMYTIKEDKTKLDLSSREILIPRDSRVIHLVMNYAHSTNQSSGGHQIVERYFYKLVFLPGADAEYARVKNVIQRLTAK